MVNDATMLETFALKIGELAVCEPFLRAMNYYQVALINLIIASSKIRQVRQRGRAVDV